MLIVDLYKIPIGWSLGFIGGVLAISIAASWITLRKNGRKPLAELETVPSVQAPGI
jgi:hypothetical protein